MLAWALDQVQESVFGALPTGRFFYANQTASRALGFSHDELMAMGVADIAPNFPADRWSEHWDEVRRLGSMSVETIHRRRDGSEFPVEVSISLIQVEDGERLFAIARDVSVRKAAEDSLRASQAKFHRAFQASPDSFTITRLADGALLEVGDGFTEIFGWTEAEAVGHTVLELGIWVDPAEREALVRTMEGTDSQRGLEFQLRRKDGSVFTATLSCKRHDVDGVPCLLTVARDITERKRDHKELETAEARLRTVVANSDAVIFQLDAEGRFTLSDGKGLEGLGLKPGQVVGLSALELYASPPEVVAELRRALAGQPTRATLAVSGMTFDNLLMPVFGADGAVESVIGIATDISSRVQAESALRESEASYRGLFDSVREAIYIQDRDGRFLDVNRGALEMYGYPREAFIGRTPEFLSAPGRNDLDAVGACVQRAFAGEPQRFEFWGLRRNGDAFLKDVRIYPGTYCGEEVVVALAMDISERRRNEEALRQAQKLESLGVLAGGIAHDFNNLMTAMLGNLNLAQLDLPEGTPAHARLDAVERTLLKASDLTKQMLAYSGRGRFVVKAQNLNLNVREMVHLLQVAVSKKAELRLDLHAHLPTIMAEAAQVQQVIMNLVTNASDALGTEAGAIRVATYPERVDAAAVHRDFANQGLAPGEYVVLEVRDSGCGMAADVLERIFDPFFTTKSAGRGLGLSALLGILRGHQAGIRIKSEPGRGSTFQVLFPACGEVAEEGPPTEPRLQARLEGTVLLVDDEAIILESTGRALESMGLKVEVARDGVEGLERFRSMGPALSLVLMDLSMPRMDGATAFLAMRAERPEVPVLLSSGYDSEEPGQDLMARGLAGFIQKPYRLQELAAAVSAAIGRGR